MTRGEAAAIGATTILYLQPRRLRCHGVALMMSSGFFDGMSPQPCSAFAVRTTRTFAT